MPEDEVKVEGEAAEEAAAEKEQEAAAEPAAEAEPEAAKPKAKKGKEAAAAAEGPEAPAPARKEKKSAAIDSIMDSIKGMTVLELAELVKALEAEFGVSAAAPVAVPRLRISLGRTPALGCRSTPFVPASPGPMV